MGLRQDRRRHQTKSISLFVHNFPSCFTTFFSNRNGVSRLSCGGRRIARCIRLCSKALKNNNTLTQLCLYDNKIGDIGGTAIGEALGLQSLCVLLCFPSCLLALGLLMIAVKGQWSFMIVSMKTIVVGCCHACGEGLGLRLRWHRV